MDTENTWVSVSTPYLTLRRGDRANAWTEEASQHGGTGTQQLREVRRVTPPVQVAAALQVPSGEDVVVRRRTMLIDDQPVELTDSYFPLAIAESTRLAEARKIRGGSTTLLSELGYAPRHVSEDVSARPPTADERDLLALGDTDWVLVLFRLVRTDAGLPVEVSVMTMIAKYRHLQYQLTV
jgi:GntR family transcriptional regulator